MQISIKPERDRDRWRGEMPRVGPQTHWCWRSQPQAGHQNPSFGRKGIFQGETAFSREEGAEEGRVCSALPGPPACQQAGITELRRMSPRDDRAATLIFSAASAPVSYLCAGMIGIHHRPPPAACWLPGEESASSLQA